MVIKNLSYIRYDMVWPLRPPYIYPFVCGLSNIVVFYSLRLIPHVITPVAPVFSTQQVVCTSPGGSGVGDALVHARTHAQGWSRYVPCALARRREQLFWKWPPHSGSDRAAVRNHDWRWRILSSWRDMPDFEMGKRSIVWLNSLPELLFYF